MVQKRVLVVSRYLLPFHRTPAPSVQNLRAQKPVTSERYHMVFTINIRVKETARRLARDIGKCPGEGNA